MGNVELGMHRVEHRIARARLAWMALNTLILAIFVIGLYFLYGELQAPCVGATCGDDAFHLTAAEIAELQAQGFPPSVYANAQVGLYVVFFLFHAVLATLIFWHRSDDRMARFVAIALLMWSGTFPSIPARLWEALPAVSLLTATLGVVASVCFYLFFLLFPNGRFVPRGIRWVVPVFFLYSLLSMIASITSLAGFFQSMQPVFFASLLVIAIGAQVYRYRYVANLVERQQSKWVYYGITVGLGWIVLFASYVVVINPALQHGAFNKIVFNAVIYAGYLLVPLSIVIAILRARLWDIDVLISRTLIYAGMTVIVVAVYVLIVGYLGALFQAESNLTISLIATGIVAVLFQPLRAWLQHAINRLLYGERDDPYGVIARLGQRLEATLAPDAILPTIVETVAHALKLPYVAIELNYSGGEHVVAERGEPQPVLVRLPLTYQGETVGHLLLAPRAPGESFTPADYKLLDVLADQAGVAAHAVRLTNELQQLTGMLQQSREQLITTREEERRRLRRDLHDGIGPTLASLAQRLDVTRNLVRPDPETAETLLSNMKGQVRETIAEIRRVVYALRPPVLDEFGLITAIREHIVQMNQGANLKITFQVPDDLPPLPAAAEVAAYRIILEAVTNVVRHAEAQNCRVSLCVGETNERPALCLEVVDDGIGIGGEQQAGVGLTSMRERATELGGTCTITNELPAGTRIWATLPLPFG